MTKMNYTVYHREMIRNVVNFAFDPANVTITNSVAAFLSCMTQAQLKLAAIDTLYQKRGLIPSSGFGANKITARLDLAGYSFSVMQSVRAYGLSINDHALADNMNVSLSGLQTMSYPRLVDKISSSIAVVNPLVAHLGPYNITPVVMTTWQNKLTALQNCLTAPQTSKAARKAYTTQINTALQDAVSWLKNTCDSTAATFLSNGNTPYYLTYKNNRKLRIFGIHHNRLDAVVVDDLNQPFVGVTVTVDAFTDPNTGKHYEAVAGHTDINGYAAVVEFFPGDRTVTVSGDGIVTASFGPFHFEHGDAVIQIFTCQPQFNNLPASPTKKQKVTK